MARPKKMDKAVPKDTYANAEGDVEGKRKRALAMTTTNPAKIRDLEGNLVEYGAAEIATMDENELDAIISTIRTQRTGGGANARFHNLRELQDAIAAYWTDIANKRRMGIDIYPDVEGVCSFLGIARSTLYTWRVENRNGFGETIELLYNDIAAVKKQIAMHGNMPALVFMADFNNNHGYVNTSKVDVRQANSVESIPDTVSLLNQINNLPDNDN